MNRSRFKTITGSVLLLLFLLLINELPDFHKFLRVVYNVIALLNDNHGYGVKKSNWAIISCTPNKYPCTIYT